MGTREDQVSQSQSHSTDDRSSDEIKENIESTRSRMDETLDVLSEKFDPKGFLKGFTELFKGSGSSGGQTSRGLARAMARPIKDNPLAAISLGASAVWLIASSISDDDDDEEEECRYELGRNRLRSTTSEPRVVHYDSQGNPMHFVDDSDDGIAEKTKQAGAAAKEKISDAGDALSAKATELKNTITDSATSAKEAVMETFQSARGKSSLAAQRAKRKGTRLYDDASQRLGTFADNTMTKYQNGLRENPMGLVLGALGIGVLAGVLSPVTRREEELYGEYSDQITDKLKESGEEFIEKGKRVGARVANVALDEAEKASVETDGLASVAEELKSTVSDVVSKVKEEGQDAAEEEGLTRKNAENKAKPSEERRGQSGG